MFLSFEKTICVLETPLVRLLYKKLNNLVDIGKWRRVTLPFWGQRFDYQRRQIFVSFGSGYLDLQFLKCTECCVKFEIPRYIQFLDVISEYRKYCAFNRDYEYTTFYCKIIFINGEEAGFNIIALPMSCFLPFKRNTQYPYCQRYIQKNLSSFEWFLAQRCPQILQCLEHGIDLCRSRLVLCFWLHLTQF